MDQPLPASGILPIDLDSFKHLYGEYQNFVYRRAYSMLGDSAAAEDVTQNTFIQVYRNLHSFRGGEFREDLFHRLNQLQLHLPPLRERTLDLLALIRYFMRTSGLIIEEGEASKRLEELFSQRFNVKK